MQTAHPFLIQSYLKAKGVCMAFKIPNGNGCALSTLRSMYNLGDKLYFSPGCSSTIPRIYDAETDADWSVV